MSKRKTIIPEDYGPPQAVADRVGMKRQTLSAAMKRRDPLLDVRKMFGGLLVVSVKSAQKYADNPPGGGRK